MGIFDLGIFRSLHPPGKLALLKLLPLHLRSPPHRFFHHPSRTFPLLIWFSPCFPVQFDYMFCFYMGSTSKFSSCYHWGISTIIIGAGILLTWCRNQWVWDSEAWRFGRTEKRRKKSRRAVAYMEASSWKDSFHSSPFQGQTLGVIVNAPFVGMKIFIVQDL